MEEWQGRPLARRTIRGWLTLLGFGSAAVTLVAASAGFVLFESYAGRRAALREVRLLADVVGSHAAAAVSFFDADSARDALASLESDPRIRLACLYDAEGTLFARFAPDAPGKRMRCPPPGPEGSEHSGSRLSLNHAILAGDERVGLLHLEARTEPLGSRLVRQAQVVLPLLLASAALASLFAVPVQRRIAGPIHDLVEGARVLARGELTAVPRVGGAREVESLGLVLGEMAGTLRDLVGRVRESAAGVSEIVETLDESSRRMAVDARSQSSAVSESSESLERIADSIHAVGANADVLLQGAEETARSLQLMDASIGQVAGHADGLASEVESTASSVSELTESIESIAVSLEGLQGSVESTVGSVAELRRSVDGVRHQAERSEALSGRTRDEAQRGREAVDDTIGRMREIRESFGDVEKVVREVSLNSESIGSMVRLINGVVEQTGMLALNAAIIAAQSGEHGHAFAVVARQVSELADSTGRSAKEISELVKSLQQGTEAAVALVERGAEKVRAGAESSEEAGRVLAAIAGSAQEGAAFAAEIARATESQVEDLRRLESASSQVERTAEFIARATSEQRMASGGIRSTTERLRDSARELERLTREQRTESQRVEQVRQGIAAIAETTGEQRADSERIKEALAVFRQGADLGLLRADELEKMVSALGSRSAALEAAVSRFRLSDADDDGSARRSG
jgi:methyl-accepting chemotaxis protein